MAADGHALLLALASAADGGAGSEVPLQEIRRSAPLSRIHRGAPPAATITSRGEEDPGIKIWARLSRRSGPVRPARFVRPTRARAPVHFDSFFFATTFSPREGMVAAGGAPGEFATGGRSERSLGAGPRSLLRRLRRMLRRRGARGRLRPYQRGPAPRDGRAVPRARSLAAKPAELLAHRSPASCSPIEARRAIEARPVLRGPPPPYQVRVRPALKVLST
jgi:hypothetical protein